MKWTEEFATGIEKIDEQHLFIFLTTEGFRDALSEGGGTRVYELFLETIESYCDGHFRLEEQCGRDLEWALAGENEAAHQRFRRQLQGYRDRFAERGFEPADAHGLVDFLDRWWEEHICTIDVHLKDCVQKAASPGTEEAGDVQAATPTVDGFGPRVASAES